MVINFDIVCLTGTVRGEVKKNNVLILRKTGKSTIVTHDTIRVKAVAPRTREKKSYRFYSKVLCTLLKIN